MRAGLIRWYAFLAASLSYSFNCALFAQAGDREKAELCHIELARDAKAPAASVTSLLVTDSSLRCLTSDNRRIAVVENARVVRVMRRRTPRQLAQIGLTIDSPMAEQHQTLFQARVSESEPIVALQLRRSAVISCTASAVLITDIATGATRALVTAAAFNSPLLQIPFVASLTAAAAAAATPGAAPPAALDGEAKESSRESVPLEQLSALSVPSACSFVDIEGDWRQLCVIACTPQRPNEQVIRVYDLRSDTALVLLLV